MPEQRNSVPKLEQFKAEHCGLAFLCALSRAPGHRLNDQVMLEWLRGIALVSTRDELTKISERLKQSNLIASETIDAVHVFTLQEKGEETAHGLSTAEGVAQPRPNCPY